MEIKQGETTALILFDHTNPKDVKKAVDHITEAKELGFYVSSSEEGSYSLRKKEGFQVKKKKKYSSANKTRFTGVQKDKQGKFAARMFIDGTRKYIGVADTPKEAFQLRLDYIKNNDLKGYENGKKIRNLKH